MRDRMERFVLLPFSIGCVSESSVEAIAVDNQPRRKNYKPDTNSKSPISKGGRNKEEDEESHSSISTDSTKSNMKFPNISRRIHIHRLFKSFKSFSQLFVYKEEIEEVEMEIGFPTDVKHVTHIGWDGSTNTNPMRGWDNLVPPQLLSPSDRKYEYEYDLQSAPAASLLQFELSMATQAARAP